VDTTQFPRETPPLLQKLWSHRLTVALLGLLVVALALRLFRLTERGLWVDEIFTAIFAGPNRSLLEVARGPLNSPLATPPLWFFISHGFMKLFGASDTVVRLPSLIAGVLGIMAIYLVGATWFGRRVGLIAALLLVLSPTHIFVSREARFYAAIVLFSLLTIYFLHRGLTSNRPVYWVGFTVATLCNLYTHLTAFFVLAAEVTYVGVLWIHHWHATRRHAGPEPAPLSSRFPSVMSSLLPSPFRSALISLVAVALCYLPMVAFLLTGARGERGLGSPDTIRGFELSLNYFVSLLSKFGAGTGLALPLFAAAAFLGLWRAGQARPRWVVLVLILVTLPFGLVLLLRPKHWFAAKYVIFILPVYLLAIALGISTLADSIADLLRGRFAPRRSRWLPYVALVPLIALYGFVSLSALDAVYQEHQDRWQAVGQLLSHNLQADDAVVVLPTILRTMTAAEIMAYYGPTADEATILTLDSAESLASALRQHRRVWVVVDHRSDLVASGGLVAWLDTQPHVDLALDSNTRVVYLGQDTLSGTLLREAEGFVQIVADMQATHGESSGGLQQ
jgi:uncharacterized membrane protein